jgi:hypothetical protein
MSRSATVGFQSSSSFALPMSGHRCRGSSVDNGIAGRRADQIGRRLSQLADAELAGFPSPRRCGGCGHPPPQWAGLKSLNLFFQILGKELPTE